ncbi:MAG TPA: peptidoglycan recognition family protein [Herpetosiphonaceae bacterium]
MGRPILRTPLFVTPPLAIVDRPAAPTHFYQPGYLRQQLVIVLHHTGGRDSLAWLTRTSSPPVSTQRLINKAGTIFKLMEDNDVAYTAGYGVIGPIDPDGNDPAGVPSNLNWGSLNIELENLGDGRDPFTIAQMQACADQIVEWWGRFGLLGVLAHREVDSRKEDPADNFNWRDLYERIDRRYLAVRGRAAA